jgi:transcription elongation factor SPT5
MLMIDCSPQTVGVIVKVDRDSFKVLDNNGTVKHVTLQEIGNKRNTRDATSFDSQQNAIGIGDIVKVVDGPHKVHLSHSSLIAY